MSREEELKDTPVEEVTSHIKKVAANKEKWAKLPASEKLTFLRTMIDNVAREEEAWVAAGVRGHGYDASDPDQQHLVAEVTLFGPGFAGGWLNCLVHAYEALATTGRMPPPLASSKRSNGQTLARVFPWGMLQNVFSSGVAAEVLCEVKDNDDLQFDPTKKPAGVWGILAPGNIDVPADVLTALFVENKVVIHKANPVNQHTGPVIERVFKPLVDAGYVAFVIGSVPQGTTIVKHPEVEHIIITGSCKSYDRIVWGSDEKKMGKPQYVKGMTAELGSVSSYIIVPGVWTDAQMEAHAQQLVSAKMTNNAHVCASPQVLITCKNWPQREEFLGKIRKWLARFPATRPFYPACDKSYAAQLDAISGETRKKADELIVKNKQKFDKQQSPIFATGLKSDSFATQNEAFCPVLGEVPFDTEPTVQAFLPTVVQYVNSGLWGSLTSTIVIDDRSQADNREIVEKAIDELQVGSVGINQVAAFSYMFASLPWGAYPGRHDTKDIQSGQGKIGNFYCYRNISKAVLRAPFTFNAQLKVPTNLAATLKQNRRLAAYFIYPTAWRLIQLVANAITGL